MVLEAQGKIDLNRPVNDYLGDATLRARIGDAADATVRRVANHAAGLPLHYQFFYADEPDQPPPMPETMGRYGQLLMPAGECYRYSNLGYGVLDHIIARLSGRSYADFMRTQVFLPLGMLQASIGIAPGQEGTQAIRYGADGVPYPFYTFDHPGASAAYCSAHDLVRFGMFHLKARLPDQKAIISDAAIDQMHGATTADGDRGYGIGWSINADEHGYPTVDHGGDMGGVNTLLRLVADQGIAVAALSNGNSKLPWRATGEILAVLLPDYGERLAARQAQAETNAEQPDREAPFKPARNLIGTWQGSVHTWTRKLPFTIVIKRDGDIHARLGSQLTALVNEVRLKENARTGVLQGDIGTEDANRRLYHLHLDLRLRGRILNGAIVAQTFSEGEHGGAPSRRTGNALSSWVELRKRS